jgi:hypothetical protein
MPAAVARKPLIKASPAEKSAHLKRESIFTEASLYISISMRETRKILDDPDGVFIVEIYRQ